MGSSKPTRASTVGRRRGMRAGSHSPPPPPTIDRANSTRALQAKAPKSAKAIREPSAPPDEPSNSVTASSKSIPQRNYTVEEKKWIFEQGDRVIKGDSSWEDVTHDFNTTFDRTKEARMIKNYYVLQYREIRHGRSVDPRGINEQGVTTETPALKRPVRRKLVFVDPNESDDRDELDSGVPPKAKGALSDAVKSNTAKSPALKTVQGGKGRTRSSSDTASSVPEWVYESGSFSDGRSAEIVKKVYKRKKTAIFGSRTVSPEVTDSKTRAASRKSGVSLRPRVESKNQVSTNSKVVAKSKKTVQPVSESDSEDQSEVDSDWDEDVESEDVESEDVESEDEASNDTVIADAKNHREITASTDTSVDEEAPREKEEPGEARGVNKEDQEEQEESSASDVELVAVAELPFAGDPNASTSEISAANESGKEDSSDDEEENGTAEEDAIVVVVDTTSTCAEKIKIINRMTEGNRTSESPEVESSKEQLGGIFVASESILEQKEICRDGRDDKDDGDGQDGEDDEDEEATIRGFITAIPINFGQDLNVASVPSPSRKTLKGIRPPNSVNSKQAALEHVNLPPSGNNETKNSFVSCASFGPASLAKPIHEDNGKGGVGDVMQTPGIDGSATCQVLAPPLTDKVHDIQVQTSPDKSHAVESSTGQSRILKENAAPQEPGNTETSTITCVENIMQFGSKKDVGLARPEQRLAIVDTEKVEDRGDKISTSGFSVNREEAKRSCITPSIFTTMDLPDIAAQKGEVDRKEERSGAVEPSKEKALAGPHQVQPTKPILELEGLLDMASPSSGGPVASFSSVGETVGNFNSSENTEKAMESHDKEKSMPTTCIILEATAASSINQQQKPQSITGQTIVQADNTTPVANSIELMVPKKHIKRKFPQSLELSAESSQLPAKKAKLAGVESSIAMVVADSTILTASTSGTTVTPIATRNPTIISPPSRNSAMTTANEGGIRRIYVDRGAVGLSDASAIPGPIAWEKMPEEGAGVLDRVLTMEFQEIIWALEAGKNDRRLFIYTCSQSAIEWVTVHHLRARKTQWRTQWGIQVPQRDQCLIEKAVGLLEERKNSGKETEFKRVWGGRKVYEGLILEAQREYFAAHGQASSGPMP